MDAPKPSGLSAELAARLDAVLTVSGAIPPGPLSTSLLAGGSSNTTVKVTAPTRAVVVRLAHDSALLPIDRSAERENWCRAQGAGLAPAVLDELPHLGARVVEWVEGRSLGCADLDDEDTLRRVAALCRSLHAGPRFVGDYDLWVVLRRYLSLASQHGLKVPVGYLDLLPEAERIANALAVRATPTVPCHNDLVPANLVDDGTRLWLLDFEYAANNDPCFELGNLQSSCDLPAEALRVLVEAYDGRQAPQAVARVQLYALLARYSWALWAVLQEVANPGEFDFRSWGAEMFDRAREDLAAPSYPRLLVDAQRPD